MTGGRITPRLSTRRLELIAATETTAAMEMRDLGRFAALLEVREPDRWPPPLNDESSQRWYIELLRRDPEAVGWGLWYVVALGRERQLIGNVGFKGRPAGGTCEIGYSLLPAFHGRGYATEAARQLITWAFRDEAVTEVRAETLPTLAPSIRVMEKCGMRFIGDGIPEEGQPTVRYAITKEEFMSRRR